MISRPQPEQHAPPVQRLRVRYAKRGRARFTSHRDFGRAFERALRRAAVPMAYSSGFSPHPRISYANASPTGAATEAEYLEIGLAERCHPALVKAAIDAALPPGLDVIEVVEADAIPLADKLTGSCWRIELAGLPPDVVAEGLAALLEAPSVTVERMTKNGMRSFDARGAVIRAGVEHPAEIPAIIVVMRHDVPLVRPDDLVSALAQLRPDVAWSEVALFHRLSQGLLDESTGEISDPLH